MIMSDRWRTVLPTVHCCIISPRRVSRHCGRRQACRRFSLMAFLSAVPHFPDEDPDQPEPCSETAHDEVEGEVENAVALARHDDSFQTVSSWKSGDMDRS